jgi:hypothetical protein
MPQMRDFPAIPVLVPLRKGSHQSRQFDKLGKFNPYVIRIDLLSICQGDILNYEKENQERIRQRHACRSHKRDGGAASDDVCSKTAPHSSEMTLDPQLAQAEDRRLLAEYESCHTEKLSAVNQLRNPRHNMLYPAFKRLADALEALRVKCKEKWQAVRAHRKKMRDEGTTNDRSQTY